MSQRKETKIIHSSALFNVKDRSKVIYIYDVKLASIQAKILDSEHLIGQWTNFALSRSTNQWNSCCTIVLACDRFVVVSTYFFSYKPVSLNYLKDPLYDHILHWLQHHLSTNLSHCIRISLRILTTPDKAVVFLNLVSSCDVHDDRRRWLGDHRGHRERSVSSLRLWQKAWEPVLILLEPVGEIFSIITRYHLCQTSNVLNLLPSEVLLQNKKQVLLWFNSMTFKQFR